MPRKIKQTHVDLLGQLSGVDGPTMIRGASKRTARELIRNGLLRGEGIDEKGIIVRITDRGRRFLKETA